MEPRLTQEQLEAAKRYVSETNRAFAFGTHEPEDEINGDGKWSVAIVIIWVVALLVILCVF